MGWGLREQGSRGFAKRSPTPPKKTIVVDGGGGGGDEGRPGGGGVHSPAGQKCPGTKDSDAEGNEMPEEGPS